MARLNEKQVLEKINEAKGNLAAVGRAFGVSRQAVHEYVQQRPALKLATENATEEMLDNAESKLYSEAMQGNTAALIFLLKTRGKKRGYVERIESEISGRDGKAIEIKATDYRTSIAALAPRPVDDSNASGEG